ncbi:CDP-glycerol glycerophosphotransferase family protein [Parahaliea mediterranea]|uniref:CDP-glycerol glycerophosphotransferase family protein n=1 Tax=Parahaliea mediterranea TaxID=651086 RepID=A0A939IIP9_9GAMM|nr:CDP-glycerol glycerophosphotransferase family protein [Parahaliea mediterranea]MBN7795481.1 CDP-glycerol glycerophosphotransferase family protein [Parahaliea mediterranea]
MKINPRNPIHWLLLALQGVYTLIGVSTRKLPRRNHKPLVILYGHQLSGNLLALYEEWKKSHQESMDMFFLALDPSYARGLEKNEVNVLRCYRLIDMIRSTRCQAMITDHGLHAMQPLLRLTNIRFIDVWHGIPFKGFDPKDFKLQHQYDEVWVSSPLLKKIYIEKFGFPPKKVIPLGYARADKLFRRDPPKDDIHTLLGIQKGRRIVLYAPTWQQDEKGRTLFPFGESQNSFNRALANTCKNHNATLVIRGHLNTSIQPYHIENVAFCSMRDYEDTEELLLQSDALICDWSSIAFDYLALERPTVFLDIPNPFRNGFTLNNEFRVGCIVKSTKELTTELGKLLTSPKKFTKKYGRTYSKALAAVYGQNTYGNVSQRQITRLIRLLQD